MTGIRRPLCWREPRAAAASIDDEARRGPATISFLSNCYEQAIDLSLRPQLEGDAIKANPQRHRRISASRIRLPRPNAHKSAFFGRIYHAVFVARRGRARGGEGG